MKKSVVTMALTAVVVILLWYSDEIRPVRNPIGGHETYLWLFGIPIILGGLVDKVLRITKKDKS
ncbi:MAG TPA: hypothetical protein DCK99_21350 [Blastocatellia bacterium]|nr:hypothetical protein [Blastocatellia bacterium]